VSGGCVIAGYVRFSASCGTSGIGMEVNGLSGSEVPSAGGDVLSLSGSALLSLESVGKLAPESTPAGGGAESVPWKLASCGPGGAGGWLPLAPGMSSTQTTATTPPTKRTASSGTQSLRPGAQQLGSAPSVPLPAASSDFASTCFPVLFFPTSMSTSTSLPLPTSAIATPQHSVPTGKLSVLDEPAMCGGCLRPIPR